MIRHLAVAVVLLSIMIGPAHAGARDGEVIDSFKKLCVGTRPNLTEINQKAHELKLNGTPKTTQHSLKGGSITSQVWGGDLPGGPIEVVASETSGQRGEMATCSISATDLNGAAFQQYFVAALQLGQPTSVKPVSNDLTLIMWNGAFGPGTTLQLMQSSKPGTPGIMITYAAKTVQ